MKKALRAGGLATALAIGVVLLGSSASASTPAVDVPPAISAWFSHDGAQVASDVLETGSTALEPGRSGGRFAVGVPARLHDWNRDFISGTSDQTVVEREEWVAVLYRDGDIVGTIAAILTPEGNVAFSYADDDVAAGKALVLRDTTGKLVHDPRVGGLVDVKPDGRALGLSSMAASTLERVHGVAVLRTAIREAHRPGPLDAREPSEGGNGAPAQSRGDASLGFGLALALAGLVLWLAFRRTPAMPSGRP